MLLIDAFFKRELAKNPPIKAKDEKCASVNKSRLFNNYAIITIFPIGN
jgi:hypothetical protein